MKSLINNNFEYLKHLRENLLLKESHEIEIIAGEDKSQKVIFNFCYIIKIIHFTLGMEKRISNSSKTNFSP